MENEQERAIDAAIEIQNKMKEINERFNLQFPLQLRIGIHTGEVLYGKITYGVYTVIGDAVNTAKRIQEVAKPESIFVSYDVYNVVYDKYEFSAPHEFLLKGKEEKVKVYEVLNKRKMIREYATLFVGRENEIKLLNEIYNEVRRGIPKFVIITGEAGIGKSRLVYEFEKTVDAKVVRIECEPYITPYFVIKRIIEEIKDKEDKKFISYFYGEINKDVAHIEIEIIKQNAFIELKEMIEKINEEPWVFIIENVQWLDNTDKEFFEFFYRVDSRAKVLFLSTGREKVNSYWYNIPLFPLRKEECKKLINEVDIDDEVKETLIDRSNGNPFFLEELIKSYKEKKDVKKIPIKIHEVVESRVDNLPINAKEVIYLAALIGQKFEKEIIEKILNRNVDNELKLLEKKEFIYITENKYSFRNIIEREIIQNAIFSQ
jgi:adenylate cyclase